jgi:quercetin dioxygenase-like cupin family protein
MGSGFRTWNGVDAWPFAEGVSLHAIGGEQLLLCNVRYEPGFGVDSHSHPHTEQVMIVTEGELTLTIDGETRTLGPGDTAVINRGVEHSVRSAGGCRFIEGLAPVPLDHVPDRERDLVLGPEGGSGHVEK